MYYLYHKELNTVDGYLYFLLSQFLGNNMSIIRTWLIFTAEPETEFWSAFNFITGSINTNVIYGVTSRKLLLKQMESIDMLINCYPL